MNGGANLNTAVVPNIRKIIDERGLKQCSVAKKAGYTQQQFNNLLNGRKLVTDIDICKITDALGVTANDLFLPRIKQEGGEK